MTVIKISGQNPLNLPEGDFIMKKIICMLLVVSMLFTFAACSDEPVKDQESSTVSEDDSAQKPEGQKDDDRIGDYSVVIDSCRLAKDYEDKDVVIVSTSSQTLRMTNLLLSLFLSVQRHIRTVLSSPMHTC